MIKNTNLDPVLLRRLPSGIAVYRSLFKDVYESRIIFAGPHKSFNTVFFMRERINKELELDYQSRSYSITTNKFLGTTVHPHPILEDDVLDCNGEIMDQFEDSVDDYVKLTEILDECKLKCSVYKAFIPKAKFRNAIDD